ncbi:MAG TPA: hypothetical protein DCQ97_12175 [Chitinophagaceae bacterium]|nr:hypothetical protein [Chitinophagaceae bacterium]
MPKIIKLFLTFYRSYFIASFTLTGCCAYIYWLHGIDIFTFIFWLKILTLGVILLYLNTYKKKEFYYYMNLGISKKILLGTTAVFDCFIFLILIILVNKIR